MLVYIENSPLFYKEIVYIFSIFASNKDINFRLVEDVSEAELIISSDENSDIRISKSFYLKLGAQKLQYSNYFTSNCYYTDSEGYIDYLSTAFYIINVIQEFDYPEEDKFGRFKYKDSFQFKFGKIKINVVQEIFDKLFNTVSKFNGVKLIHKRTKIFLSHDIDTIYGSIIQDTYYAFKKYRFDLVAKIILLNIFRNPHWFNMDKIMKIESEFDFYSTFYWLVNKGKTEYGLNNSDYNISTKYIRTQIVEISETKWENGLHKSASNDSFKSEISKLNCKVEGNRYHYIKFKPNIDFYFIEESGLKFDSSLGFADISGFRNGYGLPFRPYNFRERRPFNFVECPLHIMDTTYYNYNKVSAVEFVNDVVSFLESNKSNSVISILFHNNFLSGYKYKEYFNAFKTLLSYFREEEYKCITQSEIINLFNYEYTDTPTERR